jgi:hypothetical protein
MRRAHDPAFAFVPYPAVRVAQTLDGPLAGLTFAAKDLFDVTGYRKLATKLLLATGLAGFPQNHDSRRATCGRAAWPVADGPCRQRSATDRDRPRAGLIGAVVPAHPGTP